MQKTVLFFSIVLLAFSSIGNAQSALPKKTVDSLMQVWQNPKMHDTLRLKAIYKIARDGFLSTSPDSLFYYAQIEYDFASKKSYKKQMADALNLQGISCYYKGKFIEGIEYYKKSLVLKQEIGDKLGAANCLNNISIIYKDQGDHKKALEYVQKSLVIREEIGDKKGIATSENNMGNIYKDEGDFVKAIDYYTKSLKTYEEIGDQQGYASSLSNIGIVYKEQGDFKKSVENCAASLAIREKINDKQGVAYSLNALGVIYSEHKEYAKAIDYDLRSMKLQKELGNRQGVAASINNLGIIYNQQGDYPKALSHFSDALKIYEEIGDKQGTANCNDNISTIYLNQGDYAKAISYGSKALEIAQQIGAIVELRNAAHTLYQAYKKNNNTAKSLSMYEIYVTMRDSILSEQNQKEVIRQQYKYEYEKQAAADSVKVAGEKKITAAQLKQEKTQRYALYGGLFLIGLFALFMVNRFTIIRKQKKLIEIKEQETQRQNEVITHQKNLVEEKQREIVDSINYAKKIQYTLLAHEALLKENLNDYFVYFNPKDIVSGDFYWAIKKGNKFFLAVCDSTGHGVPGAFMSLLNISFLNEAITERALEEPNKIFDYVRQRLTDTISQDGQKDGFDGILVCIDKSSKQITYVAANNAPVLIKNGIYTELPKDKMPVGVGERANHFTLNNIDYTSGDILYLYTDGYADQFGGEKGKKFKYKPLNEKLQACSGEALEKQKDLLKNHFSEWKGDLEQVDDVCVIGIRL